jgi:hypothetical protein
MSGNRHWNPAWGLDMSGPRDLTRDKAERPDMSGLGSDMSRVRLDMPGPGVGHVWLGLLEPG